MAIKQMEDKTTDRVFCPRCGQEAIIIDGKTVKWLNCPKCKFKKLMEKHDDTIRVKSI